MHQAAHPIAGTQIPCYVFDSDADVARHVARLIANLVREQNSSGRKAVLGLAAGIAS